MHLLTKARNNVPAVELKRHPGLRCKTGWLLKHRLMHAMNERKALRQFDARVAIDDACPGGKLPGGKSGRGPVRLIRAAQHCG